MPLMTPFHHLQLNSPVLVQVGQLIPYTFAIVSKNHDPSSLRVQKTNRMKYDTQTKWSHMTWHIPGKILI